MFARVLSLALIVSPVVVHAAVTTTRCSRTYVVQEGDYCDSISKANHVSTYQLAVVNQGVIDPACDKLEPGRTICLGHAGEDCTMTYEVTNGDTCDGIQTKAGITSSLLRTNNPQINEGCTNIYIGEILCVAKSVMVSVAPPGGASSVVVPPSTAIPANPSATAIHHSVHYNDAHPPVHHHPSTSTITHAPSPTPSDPGHNDDDLPWCDEL